MKTKRQVGRVTPCAPSVDVQAAARRGLSRPTLDHASRSQRRRRDIFVESAPHTTKPRQGRHISFVHPPMPLLRSWNYFCTTFYKYAAPTVLPKLRAGPSGRAPADSEKAVLQNAVTATDQQIDALVYELYGLTPEEIKLVEGGQ